MTRGVTLDARQRQASLDRYRKGPDLEARFPRPDPRAALKGMTVCTRIIALRILEILCLNFEPLTMTR